MEKDWPIPHLIDVRLRDRKAIMVEKASVYSTEFSSIVPETPIDAESWREMKPQDLPENVPVWPDSNQSLISDTALQKYVTGNEVSSNRSGSSAMKISNPESDTKESLFPRPAKDLTSSSNRSFGRFTLAFLHYPQAVSGVTLVLNVFIASIHESRRPAARRIIIDAVTISINLIIQEPHRPCYRLNDSALSISLTACR